PLTRRGVLAACGWALAGWAAYGAHLALLVHGLGATGAAAVPLSVGAFALAWCLGLVVVIAPAGAGVREVAIVAALAPVLDQGSAIAAALCSRLVVSIGDLVCAALAGLASWRLLAGRRAVALKGAPEAGRGTGLSSDATRE
ncbi:MAG: flippase-like domain-containing protein, partial [Thermobispora bispora]|nr:flippase-like domain-containing protein [Thermobispora bispora]